MFKKILIANRGEIAVRIERTCREMGIRTVALWEKADRGSLHVRLADECVPLESPDGFMDQDAILNIAKSVGADAIHPGYGFLAEHGEFNRACQEAGIVFIGPPADLVEAMRSKLDILARAREAGIPTVQTSSFSGDITDLEAFRRAADQLGYPVVIKSYRGGRGRGERLVSQPDQLDEAFRQAQTEAQSVFRDRRVYLEKALQPAHSVVVQIIADQRGSLIHLGERGGLLQHGNQKIIEEAPTSYLTADQREKLWQAALDLARLFNYQSVGTVEFLVDGNGQFYFTEIKARIQVDHSLTEMASRVDLVREQIRIAAGEPLTLTQADVLPRGWSMMCRINAEDPFNGFLPSPGELSKVRLPGGPEVRVDTYVYSGCSVPGNYDPLVAKLTVWAEDRDLCIRRMRRALKDFNLIGTPTNLPLLQRILLTADFAADKYSTTFLEQSLDSIPDSRLRDLAAVAAVLYAQRNQMFRPSTPERLASGWHRESRRLSSRE